MKHFFPDRKHSILLEYTPYTCHPSFAALAARHDVAVGVRVIDECYSQWNGTVASLEEKQHTGRPHILIKREVKQYVTPLIRVKNRSVQRVHYPDIQSAVEKETGKQMSLRTLQHYGKEELNAHQRRAKKRTADESEYTDTQHSHVQPVVI